MLVKYNHKTTSKQFHTREMCTLNSFHQKHFFSPKCTKYRLAAGLRPDPLGELTAVLSGAYF